MGNHLESISPSCPVYRLSLAAGLLWWAALSLAAPSVALFYGPAAPLDELKAFDIVVVDPGHGYDPMHYRKSYSELYAYVSVGEVHPTRPYFPLVPKAAKLAGNPDWGSVVIDLSLPGWADFLADKMVAPLWDQGYRGFFLDTLDSYRRATKFDEAAQQQGLIRVISTLHRRFPGIRLILNRGFDVVPAVKDMVQMVAAESLFRGWDAGVRRYVEVPSRDREWLLGQLLRVRDSFGLPVLAIDYVAQGDRQLARATAARIKALGIVPWVADSGLGTLGVGQVEVMPRKIAALYDGREAAGIAGTGLHRFAEMPLNHLGYTLEYHDVNQPLPGASLAGRVAAVVLWLNGPPPDPRTLSAWLGRQVEEGVKVAILGQLAAGLDVATLRTLGLTAPPLPAHAQLTIRRRDPMFGFEVQPAPDRWNFQPLRLAAGTGSTLLEIAESGGQHFDAAAFTPWGGYVLDPFVVATLPGTDQARWVVDPFAFLPRALGLPDMPVPDATTENGRRLMFVHIGGEGFTYRAEAPGAPLAGRVLADEMLVRYKLPTTLSLAEAEVAPRSLPPKDAAEADRAVRRIQALPYVDIVGASQYAGSRSPVLTLTGELRFAAEPGGKTWISRTNPSITAVAPLGLDQPGLRQVYAAIADELPYTDFWREPFYGFQRVIETLEMTEKPRRLKPIQIEYHAYSASRAASLKALHQVYGWSLKQPVQVITAPEYLAKAGDFYTAVIARDGDAWLYRGEGHLRTLRAPAALGYPDPAASSGLAGFSAGAEGRYLHLAGGESRIRFVPEDRPYPYLVEANARLLDWSAADSGPAFTLRGYQPLEFTLAQVSACRIDADGKALAPRQSSSDTTTFQVDHAHGTIRVKCGGR